MWYRVTRNPQEFRGLTVFNETPGFGASQVYQNTSGGTNIRFIYHNKNNSLQENEEYQEELTDTSIDSITLE